MATDSNKTDSLDALDIKVYAKGIDNVEIQGVIPLELTLPTTVQTSASLFRCRYSYTEANGYSISKV